MSNTDELACTYASLILHDAGQAITSSALNKLIEAANLKVTPFWPNFFESQLKSQNLDTLILTAGAGASAPASSGAASTGAATEAAAPVEEKKPSSESEEEEMDGFDLF